MDIFSHLDKLQQNLRYTVFLWEEVWRTDDVQMEVYSAQGLS